MAAMDIQKIVNATQLDRNLTSVANAIRSSNGTTKELSFPEDFISAIDDMGRADLTIPKDVDFIDFDGRLLYSYTAAEFMELSELPPNPSYPGLVAQGWNWTLEDAQEFVGQYGALVVGQNYTTDTGKTRIYITISDTRCELGINFVIFLNLTSGSSCTIDWGDGNITAMTTTGNKTHAYTQAGNYIIQIAVSSGSVRLGYWGANNTLVGTNYNNKLVVNKVEIGDGVIGLCRNTFYDFLNLKSVSIPITCIQHDTGSDYAMFGDQSLTGIVFPSGTNGQDTAIVGKDRESVIHLKYISIPKTMNGFRITSTNTRSLRKLIFPSYTSSTTLQLYLYDTTLLTHFIVPGTYTTIPTDRCRSSLIKKLTIPATVTSISATAFRYNNFLEEIHLLPTTPPTLSNTNAFGERASDCIFYVPYSEDHSILNAYKTATNWSTFADYIQEESEGVGHK